MPLWLSLWSDSGAAAQEPNIAFEDSFEDPRLRRTYVIQGNQRLELVEAPVRDGRRALQFRLDRLRDEVPHRSEFSFKRYRYRLGHTYWYGLSIHLPHDWVADPVPVVVMQWADSPDFHLGETFRAPPVNLSIVDDRWTLRITWDTKRVTPSRGSIERRYSGREYFDLGALARGRWTDWVFRIKWDYRDDGHLTAWRDGVEVLRREGPNAYNDAQGPYLKFGLYVPWWNRDKAYYQPSQHVRQRALTVDRLRVMDERGSLGAMLK